VFAAAISQTARQVVKRRVFLAIMATAAVGAYATTKQSASFGLSEPEAYRRDVPNAQLGAFRQ
jgi:Na+/H+ antiporter NhaC